MNSHRRVCVQPASLKNAPTTGSSFAVVFWLLPVAKREARMILSSEGMDGCGKTRLALSAPRGDTGLRYLDFDYGVEGVEGGDDIDRKAYDLLAAEWMPEAEAKRYAQDVMRRFVADFREGLKLRMRTIVAD